MGLYARQAAVALRLIAKNGAQATISRSDPIVFDPVTQVRTSPIVSEAFRVVELPPGKSAEFRIGSLIGRNVAQFYIARAGRSMVPQDGDVIAWQGKNLTLTGVTHYDPAGDGAILTIAYAER